MQLKTTGDSSESKSRSIEIKEALWVASMSGIGILFLLLLNRSGHIMAGYSDTGSSTVPMSFWIVATLILCLCVSIVALLKDSKSMELKVLGILLTGIAPAVATLIIVFNILRL